MGNLDLCVWCSAARGNHVGLVQQCPDRGHFFVEQGGISMGLMSVGMVITYYADVDRNILYDTSSKYHGEGEILSLRNPESGDLHVLIGWKVGGISLPRSPLSHHKTLFLPNTQKLIPSHIEYAEWISDTIPVRSIVNNTNMVVASTPRSVGLHCSGKYCGAFNDYGEPNTSDGKYLCYSCRQRHPSMR